MKYLFASDRLYPVDRELDTHPHGGIGVEKDTLICYDVEAVGNNNLMGADTWQFKVEGKGDTLFRTHYAWALVENTPLNLGRLATLRRAQHAAEAARREAARVASFVANVATRKCDDAAP
jgi:hypothetical protein